MNIKITQSYQSLFCASQYTSIFCALEMYIKYLKTVLIPEWLEFAHINYRTFKLSEFVDVSLETI